MILARAAVSSSVVSVKHLGLVSKREGVTCLARLRESSLAMGHEVTLTSPALSLSILSYGRDQRACIV